MFFKKKRKKGFTLLELMIVVIIIGILASLALPRFVRAVNRARYASAVAILSSIRNAQLRYYSEYNDYSANMVILDVDIADTPEWQINAPAGTAAEVADITHLDSGHTFSMSEIAVVTATPAAPYAGF